jgi:hypothetical protein
MIRFSAVIILTSLSSVMVLPDANAVEPKKIDEKRNWAAYTFKDKNGKVCYIASAPSKQKGKYKKKNRGQPYALVTNRQSLKIKGEVNFIAGYNFKKDSSVKVTINKRTFDLFTEEDGAWSSKRSLDAKLVKAMKGGSRMVVVGISSRGTKTTDTYSLLGFTAMKKRIDMACR